MLKKMRKPNLGSQRILTKVTEEFIQNASSYANYKDMKNKLCTI